MRGSFADSVRNVATSTRTASATRSARRVLRRGPGRRGQRARHLLLAVALEDIANLNVIEILDADSALESLADFLDIILEAAKRSDRADVNLDAVANDAHSSLPVDDTAADRAASDDPHTRHLEQLANFRLAEDDLL